jgi:hypothetical protein
MTKSHETHDAPSVVSPIGMAANLQIERQQEALLQTWTHLYGPKSILYVSGPMTTGRLFVEWYSGEGRTLEATSQRYDAEREKHVFVPNCNSIRSHAKNIRLVKRRRVAEPTGLTLPDWSQSDYAALWKKFIQRLVGEIIMLPGWEYSVGCSREIATAFAADIKIVTDDDKPILIQSAIDRLGRAVCDLSEMDIKYVSSIDDVCRGLSSLQEQSTGNEVQRLRDRARTIAQDW